MASGSHLSKELLDLVKSIGESRSKQEEDKIITAEAQTLKIKFNERNMPEKKLRELLIRAIYVEMLGHDASFSHIHAVNLTQSKNLLVKRIGYLACSLFIDENSEMVILMISTIQRDLQSKNHLEVLAALTVLSKLCNQHILMAVNDGVQKLLSHTHEMIRKKAVMVLFKMWKTYPAAIDQMDVKMKKALCDKDPQVMAATLNYFSDVVKKSPSDYKDLVNSFVVILRQIVEHRLPREYDYHRMPAPWIQMKILEILSFLGADDKTASENMFEIISQVLKRADDAGSNIGYAIVYQCLKTICMIYPSQSLLDSATTTISRFLSSESHNLKYIGITGLALIVKIDPKYTLNYQSLVVDCLEDADDTLKTKTLDLLYRMTNKQNVEAIVEKLLSYLKEAPTESSVRKDLVIKINSLCEQYSPNKNWYVRTMNKLYEMGGDLITSDLSNKFIQSISDYEKEIDGEKFRDSTISIYTKMVKKNPNIPDSMLQVVAWIMGEYGATHPDIEKRNKILKHLCTLAYRTLEDELTRSYILSAITKLHSTMGFPEHEGVNQVMEDFSVSKHVDVQQRALEYRALKANAGKFSQDILMNTPMNDTQVLMQGFDFDLRFLDTFVQSQVAQGKKSYDTTKRQVIGDFQAEGAGLNYKPYSAPGMTRVNTQLPQSNPLFQQEEIKGNGDESLQVKPQKKVWGQPQPAPVATEPAKPVTTSQTPNEEPQLNKPGGGSFGQPKPTPKAPEPKKEDSKKLEKANALFAGIGGGSTGDKKGDSSDSSDDDKKKKKKEKKDGGAKAEVSGDLLALDGGSQSANTGSGGMMDLLDFEAPKPIPTTIASTPITADLLGDILGGGSTSKPKVAFQPVMVNTQQFGELWMQLPPVDKRGALSLPQISSAQVYANSMREKLQFHPVDIINNEVICAGQTNGNPALIHCRVNPGGNLEFTIRSNPVELADQLMSSILPETLGNVSVASSNPLGGLF